MAAAALVIAILSLLLSTFAVYIQWHQWRHGRRLKVEVRGSKLVELDVDGGSITYLVAKVTNWSAFPVKVRGVSFMGPNETFPESYFAQDPPLPLPKVIPPRDAEDFALEATHLKGHVPEGRLVAWVRLATGEEFRSPPFTHGLRGLSQPVLGVHEIEEIEGHSPPD